LRFAGSRAVLAPMTMPHTVLETAVWRERERGHVERARRWTGAARRRRDARVPHPVEDFLFEYYPYPFALLEKWHPGIGVAVTDDGRLPKHLAGGGYRQRDGLAFADPAEMDGKAAERLRLMLRLLAATRDRLPNFACHGLHEWAMVYGGSEIRHDGIAPLRLPQEEIDALVRTRPIRCSHHDAFRFFAPAARDFNRLRPSLETREDHEQPGCVHANMDLYKWAAKSMPWSGSGLLLDCFELALELRRLDMRASPYDLGKYGLEPVRIETAGGRRDYETEQRRLAVRAAALRKRLIEALETTLSARDFLKPPPSGVSA
jgi:hypothetical protein